MSFEVKRCRKFILIALTLIIASVNSKKCKTDDDCSGSNAYGVVFNVCDIESTYTCVHKKVFPELPLEIGGIFILMALKILTTMAGVGGGAIVTPLCMVFFGFTIKDAVAVSSFSTLCATFANFLANFRNRHPYKKN